MVMQWALILHQPMQIKAWGAIKLYNIEANCNLDVEQYFKENCVRVLDDCGVLLNTSYMIL